MKLSNYTLRYLIIAMLGVVALWAVLFYAVMLEEVYDNIDDGLKNSKMLIMREAYDNEAVFRTTEFGINQYKFQALSPGSHHDYSDKFISTFEYMEYDEDNEPVRLLETTINDHSGNPYKLTIRASIVEEDELLEDLLTALIALYVMIVISIAAINHVILRKVWKPFYQLLDRLRGYKLGAGQSFRPADSPITEFTMLGRELEAMLSQNEEIFLSQKQFIENASHELQTPLAIAQNKLELFAENNTLSENQMSELGKINDTIGRLIRLNKSLLMLSKIENRQFADKEVIDFNELAIGILEDFEDLASYKEVALILENNGALEYKMNKGLALTLLTNLIKNAIVHNHNQGKATLNISHDTMVISNTGTNKALDAEAVFKRFHKDSDSEHSTGLGLSIVKSIASVEGLNVTYRFDGQHNFTINFPEKE